MRVPVAALDLALGLFRTAVDLLYPRACAGCGRSYREGDPYLCPRCSVLVGWLDPVRCPLCEQPTTHRGRFCGHCQSCWPPVARLVALGHYAGPLKRSIRIFKYGRVEGLGHSLGERLAERVADRLPPIDLVVPVPGGRSRAARRGFDPSEVVARPVARALGARLETGVIVRSRDGEPMATRTRIDREVQVDGRYGCAAPGALEGRSVLVVDDVYTTGVSLGEVARLVRDPGGARSVHGAVVARAVL